MVLPLIVYFDAHRCNICLLVFYPKAINLVVILALGLNGFSFNFAPFISTYSLWSVMNSEEKT
jgi:hypothetical protein